MPNRASEPHAIASSGDPPVEIAYFSMEIALDEAIPCYSGGLGVLAGDTLRSAADLGLPMAAVTLLHRKGYFRQRLDEAGNQTEEEEAWRPEELLQPLAPRVFVEIEGRRVAIRAWQFLIPGLSRPVPVYLLDTDLPENSAWDRTLTDHLYGGDDHYRLCQEVVLGIGGVEILRALGHSAVASYHMNEGHSALLAVGLLERRLGTPRLGTASEEDIEWVRSHCVFTTHTPVPAGHDQFPITLVRQVLGDDRTRVLEVTACCPGGALNMTYLALRFSRYINGVAMHHGAVSQGMYPRYPVRAITNGVHAVTWTSPPFQALYDRHIPEWRRDNIYLRYARKIPARDILEAHAAAKRTLLDAVETATGVALSETALTIGFARRATGYKRHDLLLSDPTRLRHIAHHVGPLQIIYGGKAHPRDESGKALIRRIYEVARALQGSVAVAYVPNYDMRWAALLCAGSDLWVNTPQRPQEASGTSGMKAALNGVPSLSVLDGWWIEGCIEGATGWAIGRDDDLPPDPAAEAGYLYDQLEFVILPMFYGRPAAYAEVMRSAIAVNGSFFNTQRMLSQYVRNAYRIEPTPVVTRLAQAAPPSPSSSTTPAG